MNQINNNFSVDYAFLDSGTGGIPYMLSLKEKQPSSTFVYLGDTKNFPYGEKSYSQIEKCASQAVELIQKKWNPKTVIIACNTISVTALDSLRKKFPSIPIVGTVPAIKLAAKVSKNRRIGFLATTASVNHPYSQKLIEDFASDCVVVKRADPALISFVEKNYFNSTEKEKETALKDSLDFFRKNNCDTVILGCTHFTHIAKKMQEMAGEKIKIIDSREGVSNQAIRVESSVISNIPTEKKENIPFENMSFFVTKATSDEEKEYKTLCKNLSIPWGGVV